jgi:hypothetical protein
MKRSTPILLSVTVLLILSLACVLPAPAPTQDINAIGTAIMQTMMAAVTQTAQGVVPIGVVDSPTPSLTPLPTLSPTATLSPSPLFTATPLIPQISVSVATNCRIGPGRGYDRVGALLVGQVAEIVGRDSTGSYWYIRNPNQSDGFCWLWGEFATVTGNFAALPVYTPPPTPTPVPSFEASFIENETCVGWWFNIKLTNTGGLTFRSISLAVRDLDTNTVVSMSADKFTATNDCVGSSTEDTLSPDDTVTVSTAAFAYDPRGHDMRATITLCSNVGVSGTCVTEVIEFTP